MKTIARFIIYVFMLPANLGFAQSAIEVSQTSASSPLNNDGSIEIELNAGIPPFEFNWTGPNGFYATEPNISNLYTGSYLLTVTDSICGTLNITVDIGDQCDVLLDYLIMVTPACGPEKLGSFVVLPQVDFYQNDYSLFWRDTQQLNLGIENLEPGYYDVVLTNSERCLREETVHIPGGVFSLGAEIVKTCSGDNSGEITLIPNSSYPPYSYSWGNGANSKQLDHLPPGKYCVTVTDNVGCTIGKCFFTNSEPEVDIAFYQNPTTGCDSGFQPNGEIKLQATDHNLSYQWVGPNGFTSTAMILTHLAPGDYQVTVTDELGCEAILAQSLCCCLGVNDTGSSQTPPYPICEDPSQWISIPLQANPTIVAAFDGNSGRILLDPTGGNPPYQFEWSSTTSDFSSFEEDLTGLSPGDYCVTIHDICTSISECFRVEEFGCNESVTDQEMAAFFIKEWKEPCEGVADGKVTIVIPNPNLGQVSLYLDEDLNFEQTGQPFYTIELEQLVAGEIHIQILIDDCDFSFHYHLGTKANSQFLLGLTNDGWTCNYEERCDGVFYGEVEYSSTIDYENASSKPCKAPIYCGGEYMNTVNGNRKWINAYEYITMVNALHDNGIISSGHFSEIEQKIGGLTPCDRVRYCTASFLYIKHDTPLLADNPIYAIEHLDNGCTKVICNPPTENSGGFHPFNILVANHTFCPEDFPGMGSVIGGYAHCDVGRYRIYGLIHNHGYLVDQYPGYLGSSLWSKVEEWMALGYEQNVCANVTFCLNNFDYITDDINQISCFDPNSLPEFYSVTLSDGSIAILTSVCQSITDPGTSTVYALCPNDLFTSCSDCDPIVKTYKLTDPFVKSSNPDQYIPPFISAIDTFKNEKIVGQGFITSNGLKMPYLTLEADGGYHDYYFSQQSGAMTKQKSGAYLHGLDDWDEETDIYIEVISKTGIRILTRNNSDAFSQSTLESNQDLGAIDLHKQADGYALSVLHTDDLYFNGQQLTQTTGPELALIRLSLDGALLNTTGVANLKTGHSQLLSSSEEQVFAMLDFADQTPMINGFELPFSGKNFLCMSYGSQGAQFKYRLEYDGIDSLVAFAAGESVDYILLDPASDGFVAEHSFADLPAHSFILLAYDKLLAEIKWSSTITIEDNFGSDIQLAINEKDLAYIGFSTTQGFTIDDVQTTTAFPGVSNIYTFSYDELGQATDFQSRPSAKSKSLHSFLYDTLGLLYFSGYTDYVRSNDIIGNINFMNMTNESEKPFISFLIDTTVVMDSTTATKPATLATTKAGTTTTKVATTIQLTQEEFLLFPNPVTDELLLKFAQPALRQIDIYNAMGQLQSTRSTEDSKIRINTSTMPPGSYYVQVQNRDSKQSAAKILVKL